MSKLLATDLDGTLFYPRRKFKMIAKPNLEFVRNFIDQGNQVVLVTSRSPRDCIKVQKKLKRQVDFIALNGGNIFVKDALIRDKEFDHGELDDLLNYLKVKSFPKALMLQTDDALIVKIPDSRNKFFGFLYRIYYAFEGTYKIKVIYDNDAFDKAIKSGKNYKMMLFYGLSKRTKEETIVLNRELRDTFKDMEFSWVGKVIEITPKDCSKGEALKYYVSLLKLNQDDVFVVGDSGNDISMFKAFYPNSFCLKKAPNVVKKYANHLIKRYNDLSYYLIKESK
ncbi:MAG: HAD family hydrolase [Erysipelotrichaceae bacterium]|jgi:Cof subfamily protein (haloacid dehalogenase superfamily)|nr:HAD family hydrolase [Erysipelotrichaceae bacterium]